MLTMDKTMRLCSTVMGMAPQR